MPRRYIFRLVLGPFVLVPFERAKAKRGRPVVQSRSAYRDEKGTKVELEPVYHASTARPLWALPGGEVATQDELESLAKRKWWTCRVVRCVRDDESLEDEEL